MINHQYRFIFIHIPKTAGTSLVRFFGETSWLQHTDLRSYARQIAPDAFASYLKFAVVRNPWDRLVSDYFFQKKKSERRGARLFMRDEDGNQRTFREWLEVALADPLRYQPAQWGATVSDTIHRWSSQCDWVSLDGKIAVDKILRFENLQADFMELCRTLDLPAGRLPCRRWTWHSHYSFYYDKFTRKLVESYYADDIEAFGYQFVPARGVLSRLLPERLPVRSRHVLKSVLPITGNG